jgi:hypothetical protein
LKDTITGKHDLFISKVPSNLPIPLVSIPPINVPSSNRHIDNYVHGIFGFVNNCMEKNGVVLIFHDDDPHILRKPNLS